MVWFPVLGLAIFLIALVAIAAEAIWNAYRK